MSRPAGFINLNQQGDGIKVIYNCPDSVLELAIERFTKPNGNILREEQLSVGPPDK